MHPSQFTTLQDFDISALEDVDAIADVAFDLFLDPDTSKANSTTTPSFEIMFWLGTIGGVMPIGANTTSTQARPTCKLGETML